MTADLEKIDKKVAVLENEQSHFKEDLKEMKEWQEEIYNGVMDTNKKLDSLFMKFEKSSFKTNILWAAGGIVGTGIIGIILKLVIF